MRCKLSRAWGVSPTLVHFAQSPRCRKRSLVFLGRPFVAFGLEASGLGRANTCNAVRSRPVNLYLQFSICRIDVESRNLAQQLLSTFSQQQVSLKSREETLGLCREIWRFCNPSSERANLTLSRASLPLFARHVSFKSRFRSLLAANNIPKDSGIFL